MGTINRLISSFFHRRLLIAECAAIVSFVAAFALAQASDVSPLLMEPSAAKVNPSSVQSAQMSIVARVGNERIFRSDVEKTVAALGRNMKINDSTLPTVQANVLERLIDQALLRTFIAEKKLAASKSEMEDALSKLRGALKQQNMTLEDFLQQTHQTEAGFQNAVAQQLAWSKYVSNNATDENLEKFFADNHEKYDGTVRRASHILLRPDGIGDQEKLKSLKEQASQLREQINSGAIKFEDAAEKFSAGPSRNHGGDIGYFPPRGVMLDQFSQAAYALKINEISDPVQTYFGIHLIKVTEIKSGSRTLKDVRDAVLGGFSDALAQRAIKEQRDATPPEYSSDFPHFKPGTTELATLADAVGRP